MSRFNAFPYALMSTSLAALLAVGAPAAAHDAAPGQSVVLDEITVVPLRTPETATEALAGVSVVGRETIEMRQDRKSVV